MEPKNIGTFGSRLRLEREKLHFSQIQMAEKLGITARTQRNYEMGTRVPDADYLISASKVGVDLGFVLHADDSIEKLDEADEGVLFHLQSAFGLNRAAIHEAIALGYLGENCCNVNTPYGLDPEIVFRELKQGSPVIQAIFNKETSIDTSLLTDILIDVDAVLVGKKFSLTPEKKAQTVAMLYRFFKPDGKVLPGMIEETVKLASS